MFTGKHPVLIVPTPAGATVVIGDQQATLEMSPQQMRWKAIEFLQQAEAAEKDRQQASAIKEG